MSLNPITGVNCIFLLGAGASEPVDYPVTDDFLNLIEEEIDDNSVQETFDFFNEKSDIETLDELFRNIHGLSTLNSGEEPAVQFLEREIDSTLEDIGLQEEDESKIKQIPGTYDQFLENCHELQEKFKKLFYREFSWSSELEGGYPELNEYMELLEEVNDGNHPVFTTNYDPTVEALESNGWEVNTLFKNQGTWDGINGYRTGPEIINLFKLHGSITWTKGNHGLLRITPRYTRKVEADEERELVPPGTGIGAKRQRYPYSTHWRLFEDYLESAQVCIVIGHKLADEELAATLDRFDTKIILVNPDEHIEEHAEIDNLYRHIELPMEDAYPQVKNLLTGKSGASEDRKEEIFSGKEGANEDRKRK